MNNSLQFELNLFFENSGCIFLDNPRGIHTRSHFQPSINTMRPDFISPDNGALELCIWFNAPNIERDTSTLLIESTKVTLSEGSDSGVIKIRSRIISLIEDQKPFSVSDDGKVLYKGDESSVCIGCRIIDAKNNPIHTVQSLGGISSQDTNLQSKGAVENTVSALTNLLKSESARFTLHVDAVESKLPFEAIQHMK
tara:strand:- start:17912 stop:18499 length:588 start_codon:yes stop_codon:yes gene_type:complete